MLFNSHAFLFLFLPAVLGIASRLRGRALLAWITVASFFFYAFAGHAWFLVPMLFTTVLDFVVAPYIEQAKTPGTKRALLFVSLSGNLGLLAYFKYAALVYRTGSDALALAGVSASMPSWLDVILPAGISFYTFQTLSYIIDVYRGHCPAERDFFKFAGFVSFFPHLVAGPLTRHDQLIPGLERIAETGITPRWREGAYLFAIGLIKKVLIADRVAAVIDPVLDGGGTMPFGAAWLTLLGYAIQIYFDFSGYSDMAIGLGRLFGIELPQNFKSPYQARNPSDFWRRWHITLSQWLRDYLYISLGGNRAGETRRHVNLMATMVLGGLWHGASWTFAAWGFFHGALLIVYHVTGKHWDRAPVAGQRALMFVLVCFGWVFFRAPTFSYAASWFAGLFGLHGLGVGLGTTDLAKLVVLVGTGLFVANAFPNASARDDLGAFGPAKQVALGVAMAAAMVFMTHSSKFLYFQF